MVSSHPPTKILFYIVCAMITLHSHRIVWYVSLVVQTLAPLHSSIPHRLESKPTGYHHRRRRSPIRRASMHATLRTSPMSTLQILSVLLLSLLGVEAWISSSQYHRPRATIASVRSVEHKKTRLHQTRLSVTARKHGQDACFLPLKQLEQDYFAPRIVQIAGAYPGLTKEDLMAVTSEEAPEQGQWTYDFSDPEGPQLGTVALEGSQIVHDVTDPAVIIAEHFSIGITLPKAITEPVDLVVLVDRAEKGYADRRFLVLEVPDEGLVIGAYPTKKEMPPDAEILGRVVLVQVPWLPSMAPTKTGFMEADEYF